MSSKMKNLLRKICPATVKMFKEKMGEVDEHLRTQDLRVEELRAAIVDNEQKTSQFSDVLLSQLINISTKQIELLTVVNAIVDQVNQQKDVLEQHTQATKRIDAYLHEIFEKHTMATKKTHSFLKEIVWSDIFQNAIRDSAWLKNQVFAPGRWAIGYGALYAIYQTLQLTNPKKILEIGMGQTTTMLAQYTSTHDNVDHYVVDHDAVWMEFFLKQHQDVFSSGTSVIQLDTTMEEYEGSSVRVYEGFQERFKDMKFDLIIIDAPISGDMKEYARIDVARMMPECLNESFTIILDDVNRRAEWHTYDAMRKILEKEAIAFSNCIYHGETEAAMICSTDRHFLCSL